MGIPKQVRRQKEGGGWRGDAQALRTCWQSGKLPLLLWAEWVVEAKPGSWATTLRPWQSSSLK